MSTFKLLLSQDFSQEQAYMLVMLLEHINASF